MDRELDFLISGLSILVIGQYAWSMRAHFHSSATTASAILISFAVIATALFFLGIIWLEPQPDSAKIVGFFIEIASVALFWWAISASRKARLHFAFATENPHSLVNGGPFQYLRHPFYTSYIIFWIGWGLATWSIWALIPVAGLAAMYTMAALDEEKKFARTELGSEYDRYRRSAGFFWPRLR
jgi:protein-S-isoprenylcysteine O-methyltransferase Ste14